MLLPRQRCCPPSMRCIENYTGARCEEVFLPSASVQSRSNLSAAFVALAVLVTLTIAALCLLCRSQRSLKARPVKGTIAVTLQRRKANRMVREGHQRLLCVHHHRSPAPAVCPPSQVTNACCVSTITGHQRLLCVHHHRSPTPAVCPPLQVTESPPLNSSPVPKFNSPSPRGPVTTTDVFTSFFPDSSAAVLRSNITRKTKAVKFINRQC
ncbi:pro-neuregulin-4, membrane-bound isoform isoform X4 [Arvicola amphibius]|uniref:pro-neuregulin-4, membrane-bound isoform isoform X4 n=1 Tax=Arvicola amphibius TaxID=1047088 RepID=UPI0018E35053|nr:pro-neuregulin-4, membrane-bound isoform isoform X4 [Arvicola amphibius]